MIIQTNRLILRPFVKTDIEWYHDVAQHPDIKKWLCSLATSDKSINQEHVNVFSAGNDKDDFYYIITNKENEQLGFIIAIRISRYTVDVSYFLKEESRHQGYMHEALEALVPKMREKNYLYRFRMQIAIDNFSSLNVAKKFNPQILKKGNNFMCYI